MSVIVVGGGIIGLAVAYRLQQRGHEVLVVDRGTEDGAWRVAAGMLAPVTEAEFGEDELLELGRESLALWADFATELDVPLHTTGTLLVARDRDEAEELDRLVAFRERLGLPVTRLLPTKARRLEPALAPTVRLAVAVPDDAAVDPRAVVAALEQRVPVRRAEVIAVGPREVTLADDETLHADRVVLAAGAWSGQLAGVPVRPVGGQVLHLRDPRGPGLTERVIRTAHAYLVPRGDGRYVLGATVEERGFHARPTAGGLFELVRDASEVVPGVLELEIEEVLASVRPGTPDNAPLIGERPDGLILATGHYRNGILLAPVTADRVASILERRPVCT